MDEAGNLYGVTQQGGAHNGGAVYELTPDATKTKWTEKVLYSFCAKSNCADGASPVGKLVMDGSSTLYGVTSEGGAYGQDTFFSGTVFELALNAATSKWSEKVLFSFGGTAGAFPQAGLIMDGSGALYGTTSWGGANQPNSGFTGFCNPGCGTVFKLVPNAAKTKWTEHVLYNFCSKARCADGDYPFDALIMDGLGNLYGTTSEGGAGKLSSGNVFELVK